MTNVYLELGDLSVEAWANKWLRTAKPSVELRAELERLRALGDSYPTFGLRESLASRWHQQAAREGHNPSTLSRFSRDENERFWAFTVAGPDGHVFWTGGASFRRNGGRTQRPCRWAWEHKHGRTLNQYEDCVPTCGERRCVNVEHLGLGRGIRRQRMSDDAVLGALQVLTMRLGHPPSETDWDRAHLPVTGRALTFRRRCIWADVLKWAGLTPRHGAKALSPPKGKAP